MFGMSLDYFALDYPALAIVLAGAFLAGFTSGFAGFGTGLVAAGFWFHALPAALVPPLIVIASVLGQGAGLLVVRRAFDWRTVLPYLVGGVVGVPVGVTLLVVASPQSLKTSVGIFLIAYACIGLSGKGLPGIGAWGGKTADGVAGLVGGVLGGFAGLSGPPPIIWLQLRGGTGDQQRATYQPFNLVVLSLATVALSISGQITTDVLLITCICLPATLLGAWIGARVYLRLPQAVFQRAVLGLLLLSGAILVAQALVS